MNNKRKIAFTLAEGATHVDNFNNKRRFAFTLAEVLITLGIIGVVAALTIPTLINNYQTKSWNTAAKVFEAKLAESLKTMNIQGQLGKYGKYNDTEGFVEELQKHFKITNVCDNNSLMQCFEKTITMNDKEIDLSSIKTANDFGQSEWGTNIMGIQFANGVTGLIAYNPKCKSDPHDNRISGGDCYALVYDTSGFSDPNEIGKDARKNGNVLKLGNDGCAAEIGGICFGSAFYPTPISKAECEANKDALGIAVCPVDNDYWAGAVKQCGGVDKMLTDVDLYTFANYVYNTEIWDGDWGEGKARVPLDRNRVSVFGFSDTSSFALWSTANRGEGTGQMEDIRDFEDYFADYYPAHGRDSQYYNSKQIMVVCKVN